MGAGVVGGNVGGAVGLYFAAHHPQRVAAVIATSPATGLRPDQKAAMLEGADNLEREGAGVLLGRLGQSYPEIVRKNAAHFETFRNRYRCNDPESLAATFRMLTELEMTRELESLKCPVLVLAGEHDHVRPPPVVAASSGGLAGGVSSGRGSSPGFPFFSLRVSRSKEDSGFESCMWCSIWAPLVLILSVFE